MVSETEKSPERKWEQIINLLILQIETVSKHFGYTEEYVMEHTPAWIRRKFEQSQREQFSEHQRQVFAGFQSLLLLLDGAFNKGKDFNKIMPPSLEEAMKLEQQQKIAQESYIAGIWWK